MLGAIEICPEHINICRMWPLAGDDCEGYETEGGLDLIPQDPFVCAELMSSVFIFSNFIDLLEKGPLLDSH